MAEVDPVELVLRGFIELDDSDKQRFVERVQEYLESEYYARKSLQENLQKRVVLGPLETGCPCCGR